LQIVFAGCFGLSLSILSQFTLKVCAVAENRDKITQTLYVWVQGRSRLPMLIPFRSSSAVMFYVYVSSKSMSICNRFHARRANGGEMTTF